MELKETLRLYWRLTKPGIIYGNAVAAVAGFFLASKGHPNFVVLFAMLLGLSLVIAASCVINNYIDRDIDHKMTRTKNRAHVKGLISKRATFIYAGVLGILGVLILGAFVNFAALDAALVGFFVYIFPYSLWAKRNSVFSTHIGSIAGAVPPVVGYVAVTGFFDLGAALLFMILCIWQMPHFFSIALYRLEDYAAAGVPVLPVKAGAFRTKIQIVVYIALFIAATALLSLLGYTGVAYLGVVLLLGLSWLALGLWGFRAPDTARWGKHMFFFSLLVLLGTCIMMSVDTMR
jgi:protoheme IX farnesyltransferase